MFFFFSLLILFRLPVPCRPFMSYLSNFLCWPTLPLSVRNLRALWYKQQTFSFRSWWPIMIPLGIHSFICIVPKPRHGCWMLWFNAADTRFVWVTPSVKRAAATRVIIKAEEYTCIQFRKWRLGYLCQPCMQIQTKLYWCFERSGWI